MKRSEAPDIAVPLALPPTGWAGTLRSNWFVPVLLLAVWALAGVVENEERLDPYLARIVMLIGINVILAVSLQLINGISGQFSLGHAAFMAVGAYFAGYPTNTYSPDWDNPGGVMLFYLALAVVVVIAGGVLFGLFLLMRQSARIHANIPTLLLIAAVIWFIFDVGSARDNDVVRWTTPLSKMIVSLADLFTGMLERGGENAIKLSAWIGEGWHKPVTFLIALIGGGLCAAVAGFIIGLPTLRLRGDYLAIATLGFAEIIRVAFTNARVMGGATGLSVPVYPVPAEEEIPAEYIFHWIYGAAIITILVIWRLAYSPKGQAIRAVREDEIAAGTIGIDTTHHKVLAFMFGAFFGGVAGGLSAHLDGYINPNSYGILRSIELVVMVTLGGLGSIWGAAIAAVALTWLLEFLRGPEDWLALALRPIRGEDAPALDLPGWLVTVFESIGNNRMVVYSLLLIALMLLRAGTIPNPLRLWRRPTPAADAPITTGQRV